KAAGGRRRPGRPRSGYRLPCLRAGLSTLRGPGGTFAGKGWPILPSGRSVCQTTRVAARGPALLGGEETDGAEPGVVPSQSAQAAQTEAVIRSTSARDQSAGNSG